jgi:hypothetical protein
MTNVLSIIGIPYFQIKDVTCSIGPISLAKLLDVLI